MRLEEALGNNETTTIEPTTGLRLSEVLSNEKPVIELKALTQEMIDNSVGLTPEQEEAYWKKKQVDLVKEYPRDYYSGLSPSLDSFLEGVLARPKHLKRPGLVEAHPIANAVGQIAGLVTTGVVTAGVGPAVTFAKPLAALPTLARFAAGASARGAASFSLKALVDGMAEISGGKKEDFQAVVTDVLKEGAYGAGLGAVGSIASPIARIPAQAAYGFTTAKMAGATNLEAGINAAIFAVVGSFNRANLNNAYKTAAYNGAKEAFINRLMATGKTKDQATAIGERYFRFALHQAGVTKGKSWKDVSIKSLDEFKKAMRKGWKIIVEPEMKPPSGATPTAPVKVAPVAPVAPKKAISAPVAKPKPTIAPIKPIGEGETKVRGLAKGVEEKAIENKLVENLGDLPEYQTVNMKDQAKKAETILTENYEKAKSIAMGKEPPPANVLPESVFVAVENKAVKEGDVDTIRDLAVASELTAEATAMGQRIRTLAERDPESPVTAIKEVAKARQERAQRKFKTKKPRKLVKKDVDAIKEEMGKVAPKHQEWADFIKSIEC